MSVDPIVVAAQVVTALQTIVSRETKPGDPLVVSVSAISGGTAANVVVERVTLRGTVRWYSQSNREHALGRIAAIASGVCSAMRASSELTILTSAPVTVNAAAPVELVSAATRATGRASVIDPGPLTVSEDFSEFLDRVPGCLFTVGAGGPDAAPHHHHAFDIDERAIGLIAEIFTRAALDTLRPE
jgi:amidohydrolase